jgi:glyoxylate reductase
MDKRILITEPLMDEIIQKLESQAELVIGKRGEYNHEEKLIEAVQTYDGILSMLSNPLTEKVFASATRVKIVANYAVGFNNIDVKAANARGITVTNTPGVLSNGTADFTWALLLATVRKVNAAEAYLREGHFDGWDPKAFIGFDLDQKVLGIIGMGRIGQAVARRALGFGMQIAYTNRKRLDPAIEQSLNATYVPDYRALARLSDVLSLNCPVTPENRHMIDQDLLHEMKSTAVIINTGRGPLIDEGALAAALHQHRIAGAGLDVFEYEPELHPDLLTAPNAVLMPHIASATREARLAMGMLASDALIHVLGGGDPLALANRVS